MKCLPYGKREIFRLSPECEMKSTRRRSDFTRRRRISYCEAVFHPPEGWISLKKARRSVLFSAKERPNGAYNEVKTIKIHQEFTIYPCRFNRKVSKLVS